MPTADEDFLDRAIDNAMDTLAEKEVVDSSPEPERASPAENTLETTVSKQHIDRVRDRSRDQSGRFSKPAPEPTAQADQEQTSDQEEANAEASEAPAQGTSPQGNDAPIATPAFWSDEHKAHFAKADPELRKIIADYEAQRVQWANGIQNDATVGKTYKERLYADMESPEEIHNHKARLRMNGIRDEIDELHRYRAWDRVFKADAKTGIADLIQKNDLTLADFFGDNGQQLQQTEQQPTQQSSELQEIRATLDEWKQSMAAQQQAAVRRFFSQFREGTDSRGNVRATYFDMYRPQIAQAMSEMRAAYPQLSEEEAVNHAYEFVVAEVSKLHGVSAVPAKPAKPTEAQIAQAKRVKDAVSPAMGVPSTGVAAPRPRLKGNTWDERLESAIERSMDQLDSRR